MLSLYELKLELEEAVDCTEFAVFRERSGVLRADDGVEVLPGLTPGDCVAIRDAESRSGWENEGIDGTVSFFGAVESRRSLRRSVGLIVRAPNPPTYKVDCLRFPLPPDGVWAP